MPKEDRETFRKENNFMKIAFWKSGKIRSFEVDKDAVKKATLTSGFFASKTLGLDLDPMEARSRYCPNHSRQWLQFSSQCRSKLQETYYNNSDITKSVRGQGLQMSIFNSTFSTLPSSVLIQSMYNPYRLSISHPLTDPH